MRALWIAALMGTALSITTAIASLAAAAWWSDERFGGIGALFVFVSLGCAGAVGIWSDAKPWKKAAGLDRKGRRALRAEQRRIALDKAIRDAEREAGLR